MSDSSHQRDETRVEYRGTCPSTRRSFDSSLVMGVKLAVRVIVGNQQPQFMQLCSSDSLNSSADVVAAMKDIGCEVCTSS